MSENLVQNIYYEFKLHQVFHEAADNKNDVIPNFETWQYLLSLMLTKKLASLRDKAELEKVQPSFPLDFETFIQTISQAFGDRSLKHLEVNIDDSREQLENCRTLINMMNVKFLSKDELYQLANIIYQCSVKSQDAERALAKILKDIRGYSEDVFGFVWDKIMYDPSGSNNLQQIKLPHTYIKQEKAALEKEFQQRRVRNVHYRKQAIKVLKVDEETGIIKEIAYCADKDFPVENFKIPKEFPHYEVLTGFFNQIGATKELLFSKYLPSYLGFDDLSDPHYNQYFFEIKKGRKLKALLNDTGKTLSGHISLFKYWAKELLYAFRDITYRSTYDLEKDLTLKNVFVSDVGIKLYLKKVSFGDQRDDTMEYHLQTESRMLRMYSKLLVEMLTNRDDAHPDDIESLDIDPEIKCILYECYHAKERTDIKEQERYEQEISRFVQKEAEKSYKKDEEKRNQEKLQEFKDQIEQDKALAIAHQESKLHSPKRSIKRKPDQPKPNVKNFEEENMRMGINNELDLLMMDPTQRQEMAKNKMQKGLIEYSHQNPQFQDKYEKMLKLSRDPFGSPPRDTEKLNFSPSKSPTKDTKEKDQEKKKERQERYLTVQGLLNHPYFMTINEADIAVIIDEFEKFTQEY